MDQVLQKKILPYKNDDYDLKLSYSGLEMFSQCPYRYSIKYNRGLFSQEQTIALEVGSICHKILELKADALLKGERVDYQYLETILKNGYIGSNVSNEAKLLGIEAIQEKYGKDIWLQSEDGTLSYEDKLALFREKVIKEEVPVPNNKSEWGVKGSEIPFNFIYLVEVPGQGMKRVLFNGFIDRIDERYDLKKEKTCYRVVDYKTSKKVYDSRKLATPLQMIIYGLALATEIGELPEEYQYSFILLDAKASACSKGYLKRGLGKLDEYLIDLFERKEMNKWDAKGTPLCYWCDYNRQGIVKDESVMNICEHFCLWKPDKKTFECVEPWNIAEKMKESEKITEVVSYSIPNNGAVINGRKFAW